MLITNARTLVFETALTDAFERVLKQIDEKTVVQIASKLVSYPSVNPPGDYAAVTAYVKEEMKSYGLDVATPTSKNVINVLGKTKSKGGGRSLCLSSHTDVVSPGDEKEWKYPPFEGKVKDGILWGRGSADSKGQLASMMTAVKAIMDANVRLKGDLCLVAPGDDETGGPNGLFYLFSKDMIKCDTLVLGEASRLEIAYTFKGTVWFEIEVIGKMAHGAFPERGINAITRACNIIRQVCELDLGSHPVLGKSTVNIGMINGGIAVNQVAPSCKVHFDFRFAPPLTKERILQLFRGIIDEEKGKDKDLNVTEPRVYFDFLAKEFPKDSYLYEAIKKAGKTVGKELNLTGWYVNDVWNRSMGKIDHGTTFGPGDPDQAHSANEHITVEDLVLGTKIYALTALNICGVET